jgi:hypothetical protein
MPRRPVSRAGTLGWVVVIVLIATTFANVLAFGNSLAIRDNCRRVSDLNSQVRHVFEESLDQLQRGELDAEFQRRYGNDWVDKKRETRSNLKNQIARFGHIDCTVTIVRWIKGD